MRPIIFGVACVDGQWHFDILFPNKEIDGDHRVVSVFLEPSPSSVQEARRMAVRQFYAMTPSELGALERTAELLDRNTLE